MSGEQAKGVFSKQKCTRNSLASESINDPTMEFAKKTGVVFLVCLCVAVVAILWVSGVKGEQLHIGDLSSWVTFVFGTAVGLAGAWVAIKIAGIATDAQKKAVQLQEISNKLQDPEYAAAHEAALKIETLRASLATVLAFYRLYRTRTDELFSSTSPLVPLMQSIQSVILDPSWQGVVSGFCGDVSENLQHEFDSATARLLNSLHLITETSPSEINNLEKIRRHFYYALFQADILGTVIAKAIQEGEKSNIQLKGKSAYLFNWATTFNLSALKVSDEIKNEVLKHYQYFCSPFDLPLTLDLDKSEVLEGIRDTFLTQDVKSNLAHGKHKFLFIFIEPGDSRVYDHIVDASHHHAEGIKQSLDVILDPGKVAIQDRVRTKQESLALYYCYKNPSNLFAYSDCLDNVVVILDGFPDPEWSITFDDIQEKLDLEDENNVESANPNYNRFDALMEILRKHENTGVNYNKDDSCIPSNNRALWIILYALPSFADGIPAMGNDFSSTLGGIFHGVASSHGKVLHAPID